MIGGCPFGSDLFNGCRHTSTGRPSCSVWSAVRPMTEWSDRSPTVRNQRIGSPVKGEHSYPSGRGATPVSRLVAGTTRNQRDSREVQEFVPSKMFRHEGTVGHAHGHRSARRGDPPVDELVDEGVEKGDVIDPLSSREPWGVPRVIRCPPPSVGEYDSKSRPGSRAANPVSAAMPRPELPPPCSTTSNGAAAPSTGATS